MQVIKVRRTGGSFVRRLDSSQAARTLLLGIGLLGIGLLGIGVVGATEVTTGEQVAPRLKLETGMHTGAIELAALDALGQLLVTYSPAAHDQTLRVWQISDGSLSQTLQIPRWRGSDLAVAALSPDGQQLALGWRDSRSALLIFDRARLQVVHRLHKFPSAPTKLAYSYDGRQLAVGFESGGVRLYSAESGLLLAKDEGFSGAVTALAVDRSGRIAAAAADRTLRLYGPGLNLLVNRPPGQSAVAGLAVSHDGQLIAVGYHGEPRVEVLSGYDLHLLSTPSLDGVSGSLRLVSWASDGTTLCAAGDYHERAAYKVRCWRNGGAGGARELTAGRGPLTALAVLAGESALYVDQSPAWGIISANGKQSLRRGRRSSVVEALQVDFAGGLVRMAPVEGDGPLLYSVREHQVALNPAGDRRVRLPLGTQEAWNLTMSQDPPSLSLPGYAVTLATAEVPVGWSPAADGQWAVAATTQALLVLERSGKLRRRISLPAAARAVQVSGNGRLLVAALVDGSLRWYSAGDGEERLAFFSYPDGKRWIAWTPSGYYDTSLDGESLLGWEVSRGEELPADFFRVGLLRETYYRPDIIARVLFATNERVAREEADAALEHPLVAQPLRKLLPPVVRVLEPKDLATVNSRTISVRVTIRSPSGEPVHAPWPRLRWAGSGSTSPVERPNLKMLSVGVSAYPSASLRLSYPAKDARDIAAAFKEQEGKRYANVEVRPLVDGEARRNDILAGLEWLVQSTSSRDVAVLFLGGHGVTSNETARYSFLPVDYDSETGGSIDGHQLQLALSRIRGRVLLFLDTCHSGGVLGLQRASSLDLIRLTNELTSAESGIIVYAASTGDQASREAARWGNGAFSKAAVEGLRGKADLERSGRVTTTTLEHYISQRVRELTDESQTPTTAKPNTVPEYVLAVVPVHKPLYQRWWIWGAAGLAAASIVTGAVVVAAPWQQRPQVLRFN